MSKVEAANQVAVAVLPKASAGSTDSADAMFAAELDAACKGVAWANRAVHANVLARADALRHQRQVEQELKSDRQERTYRSTDETENRTEVTSRTSESRESRRKSRDVERNASDRQSVESSSDHEMVADETLSSDSLSVECDFSTDSTSDLSTDPNLTPIASTNEVSDSPAFLGTGSNSSTTAMTASGVAISETTTASLSTNHSPTANSLATSAVTLSSASNAGIQQRSAGNGTAEGQSGSTGNVTSSSAKGGAANQTQGADFRSMMTLINRGRVRAGELKNLNAGNSETATLETGKAESTQQLARVLRSSLGDKRSNMVLQLDPAELGKLRIEVRMQDQSLSLKFQAETQAGQDALNSRLGELQRALEQQGVRVDTVNVEWRPPQPISDTSSQQQQQPGQSQQQFVSWDAGSSGQGQQQNSHNPDTSSRSSAMQTEISTSGLANVETMTTRGVLDANGVDVTV